MYAITGASGQLGRLVIEKLLAQNVAAKDIVAVVRNPAKVKDLREKGIVVREGDYERPELLVQALEGVSKLLLISSSEVGKRLPQHKNVIKAAKEASVPFIAYTSILAADKSTLSLAAEHIATEKEIEASGLEYIFLRNGWYTENYTMSVPTALEYKVVLGTLGEGRVASASRADFAEAAAVVLTRSTNDKKIYELAGSSSFTLNEFAKEISKLSGVEVVYNNLEAQDFSKVLSDAGLPQGLVDILVDSEIQARDGWLNSDSDDLEKLIGRPTTSLAESIKDLGIL
ncbi:SDR family oxidoreductase [Bacteriovorax sp. Seq25_V]|uniref:SDR family oxidoreductase n=1 Tax=Bacteriovorax sp. Seq25_V TaxID=1201288 RepID=UPI00038A354A|nr:SDR family oxidoreductase [Bacteriovorax sp. Seq25_V]EQC44377.1 NADH(P)-binding protein, PF13460 family [Bacteriovorax sp. Seq25_V]